jgi:hypothetical protein
MQKLSMPWIGQTTPKKPDFYRSTLLNLTEGILGDFLSIQIICTVSCKASDLDPALMRPGRRSPTGFLENFPAMKCLL